MSLDARPGGLRFSAIDIDDIDAVVDLLQRGRAHLSGGRHPALFRAFLLDATRSPPETSVVVAKVDGTLAGAILAVAGDRHTYWRRFPVRHPVAGASLAAHRARKFPARLQRRRRARRADPVTATAHPNTAPVVADEARLRHRPPGPGEVGPRPDDRDPAIAFCMYVLIDPAFRGRRLARPLLISSLRHLRDLGCRRLDCSFSPADPAAARVYLSLPFIIYRYPAGYHGTIDLHDPDLAAEL